MSTPGDAPPPPADAPPAPRVSAPRRWLLGLLLPASFLALAGGAWTLQRWELGARIEMSEQQAVTYRSGATEDDAREVWHHLEALGIVRGQRATVVVSGAPEGRGLTVGFAVPAGTWEDERALARFKLLASQLSRRLARPIAVELRDTDGRVRWPAE